MTLDTALIACVLGVLMKGIYSLNNLENKVVEQGVKLQYLEKYLIKLDREFNFELKCDRKNQTI